MSASALSGEDRHLFEFLAQGRLLVAIIFFGMGVVFVVFWIKRQILRLFLISRKGPVDQAGHSAPKDLQKEIEENFNRISEMRLEPKLLSDQGQHEPIYSSFVDERDDSSYKFRRKAFDLMSCLDELLCRVNISLARKPSQTIREHLISLQKPPYAPFEEKEELCEAVTFLYEHARYGAKEFTERDYTEYSNGIDLLYDRVFQKFVVPGSLLINAEHMKQKKADSQITDSNVDETDSQMILPSVLIEDKNNGLRNRDTSKTQVV